MNNPSATLKYVENKGHLPANAPDSVSSVVVIDVSGVPESAVNNCTPTPVIPYIQVNGGTWEQTSGSGVSAGSNAAFGPQPANGGSWSWTGPDGSGFSATTHEVTLTNIQASQADNYDATFTNAGGCKSKVTFSITAK